MKNEILRKYNEMYGERSEQVPTSLLRLSLIFNIFIKFRLTAYSG